ncbi:unnamed protein product [Larinioides sclopetarius]|uniref:BTB domain-containing protein n=1 Tax=Larinioides sclopetarius TaxID=280406 RepID=A0AAV2APZ9_9ARAC
MSAQRTQQMLLQLFQHDPMLLDGLQRPQRPDGLQEAQRHTPNLRSTPTAYIYEQCTSSANEESKEKIQLKSLEELSKDLERVLAESSRFADVTLKCGGASIPAHKIILSARSPVFAAMFVNPMKESLRNEVDITDIHESALRDLLKYVYTGKTCDLTDSSAAELLNAADKYQIQDLKAVCVYFLKNTMSLENVWDILVLGDFHSPDLKSFAVDYICKNYGEFCIIEKTQEYIALREKRRDLALELVESLVKNREEKRKISKN